MFAYLKAQWAVAKVLAGNERGSVSIGAVVGIFIVILLAANLLPGAFDAIFAVDTAAWDDGSAAIWVLLPLFAILAVAFGLWRKFGGSGKGM